MLFFMFMLFFFFKQKTAYEMRISDWSSDVCSSDLPPHRRDQRLDRLGHEVEIDVGDGVGLVVIGRRHRPARKSVRDDPLERERIIVRALAEIDRKSTRLNSSH